MSDIVLGCNGCSLSLVYVTNSGFTLAATIAMNRTIMNHTHRPLGSVISTLSDQSYEKSFAYFRLWFEIGQTYSEIASDLVFDTIFANRATGTLDPNGIYPAARLVLRLVNDVESDPILAPHHTGLRSRFCARILREFFNNDLWGVHSGSSSISSSFYMDANLIAHCANLGYIEEHTIRNHILQSLISHTKVHDYHIIALTVLFKIAGATFGAYVDPAVVDRCFELLRNHQFSHEGWLASRQVRAFFTEQCSRN